MEITFVTQNTEKWRTAKHALEGTGVTLLQRALDTPEIQSTDGRAIVEYSAQFAAQKLGKPVVKTDASWEILALNGFPGPLAKHINHWFSEKEYLALLSGKTGDQRAVTVIEHVCYCEPGGKPVTFEGRAHGTLALKSRGQRGSPLNRLFVPEGHDQTAGELPESEMARFWAQRFQHWQALASYLARRDLSNR